MSFIQEASHISILRSFHVDKKQLQQCNGKLRSWFEIFSWTKLNSLEIVWRLKSQLTMECSLTTCFQIKFICWAYSTAIYGESTKAQKRWNKASTAVVHHTAYKAHLYLIIIQSFVRFSFISDEPVFHWQNQYLAYHDNVTIQNSKLQGTGIAIETQ